MSFQVEITKEHHWLQQLVGTWTYEHEAVMEPGKPPTKFTGREVFRSIGEIWVQSEAAGDGPAGGVVTSQMTLGYDARQKCFVGTFLVSIMTHLWIYKNGRLDNTKKILTLEATGPSMSGDDKMAEYLDSIEFKSDGHRVLRSQMKQSDGTWKEFMESHYKRVK